MKYAEVMKALKARYPAPEFAFFSEVSPAVGFPGRIDAVAMAMWRSRGLEIHGFEVKCSRSDWLREKKRPDKGEHGFACCDRWWLVLADATIIKEDELPPNWGLLVPHNGGLVARVKAPVHKVKRLDREFIASLLRKASGATATSVRFSYRPATTSAEILECSRSISASLSRVSVRLARLETTIANLKSANEKLEGEVIQLHLAAVQADVSQEAEVDLPEETASDGN